MLPDLEPDFGERVAHFVCGAAVGAGIGYFGAGHLLAGGIGAVLAGLLAMLFGDRFWHVLLQLFSWW